MYRRQPAVSGLFYPSTSRDLTATVSDSLLEAEPVPAIGAVAPHAGYVYSGRVAGSLYSRVLVPPVVLLVGPNHRPVGAGDRPRAALVPDGRFATPLGDVPVEERLAALLAAAGGIVTEDVAPHREEHSLEVQLPFLQIVRPGVRIVPLLLDPGDVGGLAATCAELGAAMAGAIRAFGEETLIVASSDMNHYESRARTREKDGRALERIRALDPAGFLAVTEREGITVCGRAAVAAMLEAAITLGAGKVEVVEYADSGDVNGDLDRVVGYAGIVVRRGEDS